MFNKIQNKLNKILILYNENILLFSTQVLNKTNGMKKIDHIGIAVKDLEASNDLFSKLFNRKPFHQEALENQHLQVSFFELNDSKVELIQPISEKSTVHKYLENKGEGIHHVAFEVDDIYTEIERQ